MKCLLLLPVYAPYCGELNKNASGLADAAAPAQVATLQVKFHTIYYLFLIYVISFVNLLQDCAEQCAASADCGAWYLEVANGTNELTCYLKVVLFPSCLTQNRG